MVAAKEKVSKEKEVGMVTHYFTHLGVAVVEVTNGSIKVGDKLHIKGETSDFTQAVKSMQLENEAVEEAKKGQSIGLKVKNRVRLHDKVFLV